MRKYIASMLFLVATGSPLFAQQKIAQQKVVRQGKGSLNGTFAGTAGGDAHLYRFPLLNVPGNGRVRMNIAENSGTVTIRSSVVAKSGARIENVATGTITSDVTFPELRAMRLEFKGPENQKAFQETLDAAARASGLPQSPVRVKDLYSGMNIDQSNDGSIHMTATSFVKRGPTDGVKNKLFLLKHDLAYSSYYFLKPER